jgi:hypothetical protein
MKLQIIRGSTHEIIHYTLGFHKVCERFFSPKQLTEEQECLDICQHL